jgi:WD40 repeat protein
MNDAAITAWCISPNGKQCAIGTENDNSLTQYSFPDYSLNKEPLFGKRRTLPITCISYDTTGDFLFHASKEPNIIIESIRSPNNSNKIDTYNVGVKTFAISDDNKYLCYIDEAGDVVICELHYDTDALGDKSFSGSAIATKIRSTVHNSVTRAVDLNIGCKLSWFKHKVVVPSKDGTALIVSLENNQWVEKTLVADPTQVISHGSNQLALAQFSPNGKHIVTSDVTGVVLAWDSCTWWGRNVISISTINCCKGTKFTSYMCWRNCRWKRPCCNVMPRCRRCSHGWQIGLYYRVTITP